MLLSIDRRELCLAQLGKERTCRPAGMCERRFAFDLPMSAQYVMRVTVIGGSGRTALLLTADLVAAGVEVTATIRSERGRAAARDAGAVAVGLDLERIDHVALQSAIASRDAVVYAAGAGYGSSSALKRAIDRDAAQTVVAALMAENQPPRLVMISTMGADAAIAGAESGFEYYFRMKGEADETIAKSGLSWTIVRPSGLTDSPPTGRVHLGVGLDGGTLPRGDLATLLLRILIEPTGTHALFDVTTGSDPINSVDLSAFERKWP